MMIRCYSLNFLLLANNRRQFLKKILFYFEYA